MIGNITKIRLRSYICASSDVFLPSISSLTERISRETGPGHSRSMNSSLFWTRKAVINSILLRETCLSTTRLVVFDGLCQPRDESYRNDERWSPWQNWLEENCVCSSDPTTKWERLEEEEDELYSMFAMRRYWWREDDLTSPSIHVSMFDSHRGLINKYDIGVAALISRLTSPVSLEHPATTMAATRRHHYVRGRRDENTNVPRQDAGDFPGEIFGVVNVLRKTAQSSAFTARVMAGTRDSEAKFRRIAMGGASRKRERLPVVPLWRLESPTSQ